MSKSTGPEKIPVMVLDDDPIVLKSLTAYLRLEGYKVSAAQSLQEGIAILQQHNVRVALTDVRLPEGSGFDLLQSIKSMNLSTAVIMLTGYGTIEDAVRAIKAGAFDYVTKPISDEEVRLSIERALQQQELREENRRLRQQLNMSFHLDNIPSTWTPEQVAEKRAEVSALKKAFDIEIAVGDPSQSAETLRVQVVEKVQGQIEDYDRDHALPTERELNYDEDGNVLFA